MIFKTNIKSTEVIERERINLENDYQIYLKVENSEKLKTFLALKEKVESTPFQEKKKQVESLRFKGSPEEKMVKEFESLEKNSSLKRYFNLKSSNDLDRFLSVEKSGKITRLNELEKQVNSSNYKNEISSLKQKVKSETSGDAKKELANLMNLKQELENLKTADEILFYYRFKKSKAYKNFIKVDGSELLNQFEDLKKEIESKKFADRKAYLEDKLRYEKTEDFKTIASYDKLNEDNEIKLYLKYHQTNAFRFLREWTPTFIDDFNGKIDKAKWSFISPIAEQGPGRNFSILNQLHYAKSDDKFDVEDSILTLETTHHKVDGLYWDGQFGFVQKPFQYVSGLVHTLKSFKQEYGRFEVKIKSSKVKGVISTVSLVSEDEELCIRLFYSNGAILQGGLITTDHMQKHYHPVKFSIPSKGYVIVTLNWTPEKLEWKINEKVAGVITHKIPHTPLGIRIESEVVRETGNLPHRLDIDWVKCYKRNS